MAFTATRVQVATYLLGVCPFSIAFLVFLNSSVSFVVTDLIGREDGVGNAVGNLGFADELVALVACPVWGLLSDRIGVRNVCFMGYAIICIALVVFVQAKNVYPQLLLARLFFSLGAAAASTMVTAVLPAMSYVSEGQDTKDFNSAIGIGHAQAPSISSELTITPMRFQTSSRSTGSKSDITLTTAAQSASTSKVAGFVGMFAGFGALFSLFVFLPLPAAFQKHDVAPGAALQYSYYAVASVAFILSFACLLGLRGLRSDVNKGWAYLLRDGSDPSSKGDFRKTLIETSSSLGQAFVAGFHQRDIAIGYLGGFVARASSIGISLFVPLLVNALFTSSGLCAVPGSDGTPGGLPDIKRRCPRAYVVAAELTGVSQMIALLSAPLFGYWSANTRRKDVPLAVAAAAGIIGYPLFAAQFDPDDKNHSARAVAFVAVCLIGFSQIGAIVCSLAALGTGVLTDSRQDSVQQSTEPREHVEPQDTEQQPLLAATKEKPRLTDLKGSVAGVYSFFGGAAILILTKAGGALFDKVSTGAPFYIMAAFNVMLLISSIAAGLSRARAETDT